MKRLGAGPQGPEVRTRERRGVAAALSFGGKKTGASGLRVLGVQRKDDRGGSARVAIIGVQGRGAHTPATVLARLIGDALDPTKQPGKVRTLADMSPEERAALEAQYAGRMRGRR